jgi:hypothetical protein
MVQEVLVRLTILIPVHPELPGRVRELMARQEPLFIRMDAERQPKQPMLQTTMASPLRVQETQTEGKQSLQVVQTVAEVLPRLLMVICMHPKTVTFTRIPEAAGINTAATEPGLRHQNLRSRRLPLLLDPEADLLPIPKCKLPHKIVPGVMQMRADGVVVASGEVVLAVVGEVDSEAEVDGVVAADGEVEAVLVVAVVEDLGAAVLEGGNSISCFGVPAPFFIFATCPV